MHLQLIFALILINATSLAYARHWQLECPDLSNYQECAMRYEANVIKKYPSVISKAEGKLQIRLKNGEKREIADEAQVLNVVSVIKKAQIVVIREQFHEGNTWHLLNRISGDMTEIAGFPVPSPDANYVFVIEPLTEANYTTPKAAIYQITTDKPKLVWLAECTSNSWGSTKPRWKSNSKISFTQTKDTRSGFSNFEELGIVNITKLKNKWVSSGLKC